MTGYFVTGTDTGVGKTFVAAGLARRGTALGRRVFAFKPIETGCSVHGGDLIGEDQEALAEAAGNWQQGLLRGVFRFPLPAAPLVAAAAVGSEVDLDLVVATCADGAKRADLTIVEGAGGWRVPITRTEDMSRLARRLGLPVIVVGRATLGTINHTLLTVEAVARDGCAIAAVVLSKRPEDDAAMATSNLQQVARHMSTPVLLLDTEEQALDGLLACWP